MVVWRVIGAALLVLSAGRLWAADPAASALEEARAALEREDRATALKIYNRIPLKHPLWKEKIEDLVRYEILHGNPEEAWRIIQVDKRVFGSASALADYERLAIFRAGACPLALEGSDALASSLVTAATYRFFESNLGWRDRAELESIEGTSLASGLTPYLADIPNTRLQAGRGCRVQRLEIRSANSAARRETTELLSASRRLKTFDRGALMIQARLLDLATDLSDEELGRDLRRALPDESKVDWLSLPDLERRKLFAHYFPGARLAEVTAVSRPRANEIALRVLRQDSDAHVSSWLAMVDLEALAPAARAEFLSRVEGTWRFAGRAWVLLRLARSRYELGQASEALTVLRRLLLEREEEVSEETEEAAVDLAARIFAEYRFEDKLVGAMRAALPTRLWKHLLDSSLVVAAVRGRGGDFAKLLKMEKYNPDSMRARELDLWRSLSQRNQRGFLSGIKKLGRGPGADRSLIELGGRFAMELIEHPKDEGLKTFARSLAGELRGRLRAGDARGDDVANLAQILEGESEWAKGARSVRQGVISVGTASWAHAEPKSPDFKFEVPTSLPRRELIVIPERATNRAWVLSIEKR